MHNTSWVVHVYTVTCVSPERTQRAVNLLKEDEFPTYCKRSFYVVFTHIKKKKKKLHFGVGVPNNRQFSILNSTSSQFWILHLYFNRRCWALLLWATCMPEEDRATEDPRKMGPHPSGTVLRHPTDLQHLPQACLAGSRGLVQWESRNWALNLFKVPLGDANLTSRVKEDIKLGRSQLSLVSNASQESANCNPQHQECLSK